MTNSGDSETVESNERKLREALEALLELLPSEPSDISALSSQRMRSLRDRIQETLDQLQRLLFTLDPIKQPAYVLDPADPAIVGRLIADTLLEQPRGSVKELRKFYGSGIYAIYYKGHFDAYQPLVSTDTPIYVGKADPAAHGARTPFEQGTRLWNRLNDHRKSIEAAENLDVADFECRFLVVKSAWQSTAEIYLIEEFHPIWNRETDICYGFGKHGDSAETRANTRSPWDTLHPGRAWAARDGNVPYPLGVDQIKALIAGHFMRNPPRR